jgi:hypothetical protein
VCRMHWRSGERELQVQPQTYAHTYMPHIAWAAAVGAWKSAENYLGKQQGHLQKLLLGFLGKQLALGGRQLGAQVLLVGPRDAELLRFPGAAFLEGRVVDFEQADVFLPAVELDGAQRHLLPQVLQV